MSDIGHIYHLLADQNIIAKMVMPAFGKHHAMQKTTALHGASGVIVGIPD